LPLKAVLRLLPYGHSVGIVDPGSWYGRLATLTLLPSEQWVVATPQGFFQCSEGAARFLRWNEGGALNPIEHHWAEYHRPDAVRESLTLMETTALPAAPGGHPAPPPPPAQPTPG